MEDKEIEEYFDAEPGELEGMLFERLFGDTPDELPGMLDDIENTMGEAGLPTDEEPETSEVVAETKV